MTATTGNAILGNQIHSNTGLGIDLYGDNFGSPETNDSQDPDSGPNNQQNFPVLSSATVNSAGDQVTIVGQLDSLPGTSFRIEFFSNDNSETPRRGRGLPRLGRRDHRRRDRPGQHLGRAVGEPDQRQLHHGDGDRAGRRDTAQHLRVRGQPAGALQAADQPCRPASTSYNEQAAAVQMAPAPSVTDPDTVDFNGGNLQVTIASGGTANDAADDQGHRRAGYRLVANEVYHGGSKIGTWSGGDGTNPLQINCSISRRPRARSRP